MADARGTSRDPAGRESGRRTGSAPGRTAAATGQAARAATGRAGSSSRSSSGAPRRDRAEHADDETHHAREAHDGQEAVCPVAFCPICTAVSTVNRVSPDVVQHLLLAGQQFLMALKAVVDARAADFEDGADDESPMQRIDIE